MAREEQQPMSDARLAELATFISLVSRMIDEQWSVTGTFGDDGVIQALKDAEDIAKVLPEVERLRAREAALVEIVRAVADARGTDSLHDDTIFLRRDGAERVIEQARALLASGSAGSEGSERNDND